MGAAGVGLLIISSRRHSDGIPERNVHKRKLNNILLLLLGRLIMDIHIGQLEDKSTSSSLIMKMFILLLFCATFSAVNSDYN